MILLIYKVVKPNLKQSEVLKMKEILSIVNELKATTKTNEKIAILTKNKDNELLQKTLFYTYNPNYQFGLSEKKIRQFIANKNSFIQTNITRF